MVPNHALYQAKLRPVGYGIILITNRAFPHPEFRLNSETVKVLGLIITLVFGSGALISRAQDAAPPTVNLGPRPNEQPVPTPLPTPVESVTPVTPDISQLDAAFKQSSLGKEADYRSPRAGVGATHPKG